MKKQFSMPILDVITSSVDIIYTSTTMVNTWNSEWGTTQDGVTEEWDEE